MVKFNTEGTPSPLHLICIALNFICVKHIQMMSVPSGVDVSTAVTDQALWEVWNRHLGLTSDRILICHESQTLLLQNIGTLLFSYVHLLGLSE